MLGLIKAWLEMPVEEDAGKGGGKRRTNRARRERKGSLRKGTFKGVQDELLAMLAGT